MIGPLFFWYPRRRPGKRLGGVRWGFRRPVLCGSASVDGRRSWGRRRLAAAGPPSRRLAPCGPVGPRGVIGSGAASGALPPPPLSGLSPLRGTGAKTLRRPRPGSCAACGGQWWPVRAPRAAMRPVCRCGRGRVPLAPGCLVVSWCLVVWRLVAVPGALAVVPRGPGPPSAALLSGACGWPWWPVRGPAAVGQRKIRRRGCSAPAGAGGGCRRLAPPAGGSMRLFAIELHPSLLCVVLLGAPCGAGSYFGLRGCISFSYPL